MHFFFIVELVTRLSDNLLSATCIICWFVVRRKRIIIWWNGRWVEGGYSRRYIENEAIQPINCTFLLTIFCIFSSFFYELKSISQICTNEIKDREEKSARIKIWLAHLKTDNDCLRSHQPPPLSPVASMILFEIKISWFHCSLFGPQNKQEHTNSHFYECSKT